MGLARFLRRGTTVSLEAYEALQRQVAFEAELADGRADRIRALEAVLAERNREVKNRTAEVELLQEQAERLEGRINRTLARYEGQCASLNDIASELGASDAKRQYVLEAVAKYLKVPAGKKGYAAARKKLAELV